MLADLPKKSPFPYKPEKFTKQEKAILSRFFTNIDKPVFAIFGLPQEVVGALFSRYSRTAKSIRRVFLDEFWSSEDLGIGGKRLGKARTRTQDFYRKVFAEFGDDSVIQMGSVHVAFEFVSQIAAKAIEDGRIAAAYIEKSTRYVDFGNKSSGHYLYMEVPEIMESEFAEEFIKWNESLFDAYVKHLSTTKRFLEKKYPLSKGEKDKVRRAYERALKAKTLDTIRVFLPTTTVTNLGAHFSGQAAENTFNKMIASPYSEIRLLGKMALEELMKVSPNFLQHVDHSYGERTRSYFRDVRQQQEGAVKEIIDRINRSPGGKAVQLVDWDKDADVKLASQVIYTAQRYKRRSKAAILAWARKLSKKKLQEIIISSMPDRSTQGLNRRHKLPRAFEHVFAEVEFDVNFGIYRDLQRNRMSSTERQTLGAERVFIPREFRERGMTKVLRNYMKHVVWTRKLHRKISKSKDPNLARAAEYVTIFGNKLRFNVRANIRQWVFFAELRTIEGGHPSYRHALQKATRQIIKAMPFLKPLFAHVDWKKDYGLGRLKAEIRTQQKLSK
jgi:thymidylate synthase ThyX